MDRRADRYTSPELSRQLAEAGLETKPWESPRWRYVDDELTVHPSWRLFHACAPELATVRALRLDEVLEELTRDREGGPLLKYYELCGREDVRRHFFEADSYPPSCVEAATPVGAAGLVLLALLRERGGK